ncbi:MAG: ABC transporter permease [Rhodoglobus sp.]|tara:strand:+ start:15200 stop:16246 length:1047 start_codon:yes stop_codon:yes gene_type:complete
MNKVFKFLGRDRDLSILGFVTTAVIVVLYLMLGSRLFSLGGLQSMSIQVSEFGFLALAMGLAMLVAGIDLSVVAAAGLSGVMAALTMSGEFIPITPENETQMIILGVVVALTTGLLTGLLNGFIIAKLSVPPILATLGTMILYTGIGTAITSGSSISLKVPSFAKLATSTVGPLPMVFVMLLATFIIVSLILTRTRFGRKVYLFGENEVAVRFSGIKSERVILMTYAIIGILVGLAAIVIIARANSMRVGFGESYLLQAILVVVLAGFNPLGGKGRVLNLAIALVLLQVISTSMTAFAFSPYAKNIVWGGILIAVMGMNHYLRAGAPRARRQEPPSETAAIALEQSRR